ncbi:hypothetical protein [Streptomyces olivoreticuli]|uniref:hypothetical protein n=1 Tax=Streptomyces olivoreticuli TaxID=68246 RepID=UPI000E23C986|nr:hypothetical protein [Streptomyces olivoreticuli]
MSTTTLPRRMLTAEEIMRFPFRQDLLPGMADLHPSTGTGNSSAKLNEAKVRAIRSAAAAGAHLAALGHAFGISERAARHIVDGTSWRHVR